MPGTHHEREDDLEPLARRFVACPDGREELDLLAEAIAAGHDSDLLKAVLRVQGYASVVDDWPILERTMQLLKRAFEVRPDVAGVLMVHLRPFAGHAKLHDIWDGIDLWLASSDSPALADGLERLASRRGASKVARECRNWAAIIRGKAGAAR
jgi:hypothetical protein